VKNSQIGWLVLGTILYLAGGVLSIFLIYGVVVIIFRYAFGVELWNPFH
jgi:hypothetical protein